MGTWRCQLYMKVAQSFFECFTRNLDARSLQPQTRCTSHGSWTKHMSRCSKKLSHVTHTVFQPCSLWCGLMVEHQCCSLKPIEFISAGSNKSLQYQSVSRTDTMGISFLGKKQFESSYRLELAQRPTVQRNLEVRSSELASQTRGLRHLA